jgi:5-methylcytosine-specific restriction endonuclease McrA
MGKRKEFSETVKRQAWERCGGVCECGCGVPIREGDGPEYDHRHADFYGGDNTLDNCQVLRIKCHKAKTAEERPAMDKTRRLINKRISGRKKGWYKPPGYRHPWGRRKWD